MCAISPEYPCRPSMARSPPSRASDQRPDRSQSSQVGRRKCAGAGIPFGVNRQDRPQRQLGQSDEKIGCFFENLRFFANVGGGGSWVMNSTPTPKWVFFEKF